MLNPSLVAGWGKTFLQINFGCSSVHTQVPVPYQQLPVRRKEFTRSFPQLDKMVTFFIPTQ